jgi:hypothetical protein
MRPGAGEGFWLGFLDQDGRRLTEVANASLVAYQSCEITKGQFFGNEFAAQWSESQ